MCTNIYKDTNIDTYSDMLRKIHIIKINAYKWLKIQIGIFIQIYIKIHTYRYLYTQIDRYIDTDMYINKDKATNIIKYRATDTSTDKR